MNGRSLLLPLAAAGLAVAGCRGVTAAGARVGVACDTSRIVALDDTVHRIVHATLAPAGGEATAGEATAGDAAPGEAAAGEAAGAAEAAGRVLPDGYAAIVLGAIVNVLEARRGSGSRRGARRWSRSSSSASRIG